MINLKTLQNEIGERLASDSGKPHSALLKAQQELGLLSAAYESYERGDHGSPEHNLGNIEHAAAAIVVALAECCARLDLDLDEGVAHLWGKRKLKMWHDNPVGPSPRIENQ